MIWLFDIDGTLIRTGGAGSLAMKRALAELFGVPPETRGVSFSGCTDRGIVANLFAAHGLEETEQHFESFYSCYLSHLDSTLQECDGSVLPGAKECLDLCLERGDTLGLLTGNMQAAARKKLQRFGLWDYFPFGGFGDTEAERDSVAAIAVVEAERHTANLDRSKIVVVGDTPNDIQCARANDLQVACVPTGEHTADDLASHRPDFLLKSLHECVAVVTIGAAG